MSKIFTNAATFTSFVVEAAQTAGKCRLFLDVEAAGLHAAGTAPISFSYDAFVGGAHVASYTLACREGETAARALSDAAKASGQFDFFGSNVLPKMGNMTFVETCRDLREQAWQVWVALNGGKDIRNADRPWEVEGVHYALELWGDVIWPVETAFFSVMIADGEGSRDWAGPTPILDVASVLATKGFDPFNLPRFKSARMDEGMQHHPSADNRASHAILVMAEAGTLSE